MATTDALSLNKVSLAFANDYALARRLAAAEDGAFREIAKKFSEPVYRLARIIVGDEGTAQEVVNDVFLQVFKKIRAYRGEASLSTWIQSIAVNIGRMRLRSRKSREKNLPEFEFPISDQGHMEAIPDWSKLPDKRFEERDVRMRIAAALSDIPESLRTPYYLVEILHHTREEACCELGIGLPALRLRLHRARLQLRQALGDLMIKEAR